jgi:hypothetical protein
MWKRALDALAVAALVMFGVFATEVTGLAILEGRQSSYDFAEFNYSELLSWCITGGALALVTGVVLLWLGAARTFAAILALCYFVLVVGFDLVSTLIENDHGVLSARHVGVVDAAVFLVAVTAVLGQLNAARRETGANALTSATGFLALSLFVVASAIWIRGGGWLGIPAGTPLAQSAPIEAHCIMLEDAWDSSRRIKYAREIIARELQVPEDRVVPAARFDTDLNAHPIAKGDLVRDHFRKDFCLDYETGDEYMLITVEDAYEYVKNPAEFRETHRDQSRDR